MIALDTNILVALHRADLPGHAAAMHAYRDVGGDTAEWAIPWPCVHEFFGVATHPRVFVPPSSVEEAITAVERWRARPSVRFLAEDETYWTTLSELVRAARVTGSRVHDARIAALCLDHGVRELWTADRDFSRFPRLRTRNPLVAA